MTLAQVAVEDKDNEITAVEDLLRGLVLEGHVLTMDALLTQRGIAHRIVDGGGGSGDDDDDDDVMIVKDYQRQLRADIEQVFAMLPLGRAAGPYDDPRHRPWLHRATDADDERRLGGL